MISRESVSFPIVGASRQNSLPSCQIESQLQKSAHNALAKVNARLEIKKAKTNESKTSAPADRDSARRRWIVVRHVGLALQRDSQIKHWPRLQVPTRHQF
jgi:hypothetical protein